MFKMIGGDGREYGQITADQLREYIADNRANGQTLVQEEGSGVWQPISALPEFAEALGATGAAGAAQPALAPGIPAGPGELERLAERDYALDVGGCLGRGWQLLRQHFVLLFTAASLVWMMMVGSMFTCGLVTLVIGGALHGGLMVLYLKLLRQQPASVLDVFSGFSPWFVQLMFVWVVSQVASGLGMICLAPGIYLKVIWVFGLALAADRRMEFWPALELSRRMVSKHWFQVAALVGLAYLPFIVVWLYTAVQSAYYMLEHYGGMGVGVDWSRLFKEFNQVARFNAKLELQRQLVLLFNLPFAYAVLMRAYEDIFGARRPAGH
jgi:hypothetical protein